MLWKRDREEDARAALAAAAAIESGPESGAEIARVILEVALGPLLERLDREMAGDEENSRPVKT